MTKRVSRGFVRPRSAAVLLGACVAVLGGCRQGEEGAGTAPARAPAGAATNAPAASPAVPAGHPPLVGASAAPAAETVTGRVEIAHTLRTRQESTAVLFVMARRAGGGQIVAVKREEGVRLPRSFELSGRDSMTGDVPFSGALDITARLSRTGDAMPAAGDLEGVARNVAVGARGVRVVIDTVRP